MSRLDVSFGAKDTGLEPTLKRVEKGLKGAGTEADKAAAQVNTSFDQMKSGAMAVGKVFAGAFAITKLVSGIKGLVSDMDELGKTATRLRLPVGEVQTLQIAAKTAGSDINSIVRSMERAQVAATEAGRGVERYVNEFEALNINANEFNKLDHQGRLRVIAEAYSNASDKGEAYTSLTRIMGRSVGELLPLLEKGAAGIDDISNSISKLDDADVRAIEEMNDALTMMSESIKTSLMQSIIAIRPQLEWLTENLKNSAQMIGDILGNKVGGKGTDAAAAMETLRQIEAAGGIDNLGQDSGNKRINDRRAALDELWKSYDSLTRSTAESLIQLNQWREAMMRGDISQEEFEKLAAAQKQRLDTARQLAEQEKESAIMADELAAKAVEQSQAAEKALKMEGKLTAEMEKRLAKMNPVNESLEETQSHIAKIFEEFGSAGDDVDDLVAKMRELEDPTERVRMIEAINEVVKLRGDEAKLIEQIAKDKRKADEEAKKAIEQQEKEEAAINALFQKRIEAEESLFAMRLRSIGRDQEADALEKEVAMRNESLRMARDLGITQQEAIEMLKEQEQLQAAINNQMTVAELIANRHAAGPGLTMSEQAKKMREDLGAMAEVLGKDMQRMNLRDIAKEMGIDRFGKSEADLIREIQKELEKVKSQTVSIEVDPNATKEEVDGLLKQIGEDFKNSPVSIEMEDSDAKKVAQDIQDQLNDGLEIGIKNKNATGLLDSINKAVDHMQKLLEKIEPKLPTPSII
jgi:hypothetical protein